MALSGVITTTIKSEELRAYVKPELRWTATQDISGNYSTVTADVYYVVLEEGNTYTGSNIEKMLTNNYKMTFTFTENPPETYSIIYYDTDGNPASKTTIKCDFSVPQEKRLFTVTMQVRHDFEGINTLQTSIKTRDSGWDTHPLQAIFEDVSFDLDSIDRATYAENANDFTDEETPAFTYKATTAKANMGNGVYLEDTIETLQAALSFDGLTADIAYRDIPIDGSYYAFTLTETERELLRERAQGSDTVPIFYLLRTVRAVGGTSAYPRQTAEHIGATQRRLTIVGSMPTLNPSVKDIKPETLALTGDENTFVRYESMAEYEINATASKHATIETQYVQCGSVTKEGLPNGIIDDTESGDFIFTAIDSRNLVVSTTLRKNLVEYVKPTCNQATEIELSGETGAKVTLTVTGNYFNGSFGAAANTLKIEVRHTQNDGNMGEWVDLTDGLIPVFNGNTYKLEVTISGFDYSQAYTFQCRATDKLNYVETSQHTIRLLPVFDWSETDFNYNVPVNIDADTLSMHGGAVLRHGKDTNNTVLSATGGRIYIRPGGTDNTTGETVILQDGTIQPGGKIDLSKTMSDYIIENGAEAMGSNGTWYWAKWASGKAECYGVRNFGNMAVSTAWGGLYRSAAFSQDIPYELFKETPAIFVNLINSSYGGWIARHETSAPSATSTGTFIVVRPASATITPSLISFYAVGRWK